VCEAHSRLPFNTVGRQAPILITDIKRGSRPRGANDSIKKQSYFRHLLPGNKSEFFTKTEQASRSKLSVALFVNVEAGDGIQWKSTVMVHASNAEDRNCKRRCPFIEKTPL
jgi:hypothetical protein